MSKEIYISSTPHETRLAIVEKEELSEIYYERENEYTLAGSIYNGRVTRVLPGMQSAFVDVGLERDAFLYITDFLEEQGELEEFEGATPAAGDRGVRSERGEQRSERGDRGRRGERDRGGDRQGRGRTAEPEEREEAAPVVAFEGGEPKAVSPEPAPAPEMDEETGEGSRRWRGRRGRRRGRGEARTEGAGFTGEISSDEPVVGGEEAEFEGSFEAAAATVPEPRREDRGEGRRDGRGRRDRGERRDRRESFGGESRVEESVEVAPAAEPFILPGESLSKYRRGGESEASVRPAAATAPKTAPAAAAEFTVSGWDGGFVLPGESLSRRTASAAPAGRRAAGAVEDQESAAGRDRRRERDERRGRRGRRDEPAEEATPTSFSSGVVTSERGLAPMDAVQPGVSSQHEPESSTLPLGETAEGGLIASVGATDDAPGFEVEAFEQEQELQAEIVEQEPVEFVASTDALPEEGRPSAAVIEAVAAMHEGLAKPALASEPEFHESTTEYEPEENAAASFRVDPAGPREFRQSGEGFAADAVEDAPQAGMGEHQFTAVQPSGEMLSELPEEMVIPGAEDNLAGPIEHETAVQSVRLSEADPESALVAAAPQGFAPGDGVLEEELLDEEDDVAVVGGLVASFDDTEEETLEAGSEVEALVRDRTLDDQTLSYAEEDEEGFDLDESDLDDEELEEGELEEGEVLSGSDVSEIEEEEAAEVTDEAEEPGVEVQQEAAVEPRDSSDERGGRRDGRRDGRRSGRDRGGREPRDSREARESREPRESRDRDRGRSGGSRDGRRPSRHSMQTTDLPAISDLLKPGQEVLVQIAKEPIAKKGARITSHIALPGRFLVFMPTVNHVGVSRKIESDSERRRLKEILLSEKGEATGGFIVRTAASGASEEELRSDLRFLLNLWADIKSRSEGSKSPALIYHDLNLVERILRDQVTDTFSAIWVDTEDAYERVLRFLQRFQPSLMRRVKLYTKDTPLFEQFGISEEINKALRSKVWLKSGGSIVINQTEALVAIDINTGKYVGKTARLEDTIVKTNLDAIPEIVRQIRLRDLGGIIVIDFIDMDDRKNRQKVLIALEEELKNDRAPSKVLQFNDFGLVAITRKRVKQSLERTLSTTCNICTGTGMVKSPVTVCNEIYIELRKMHKVLDKGDVMVRVNPEVVKHLKSNNARWLQDMEEVCGKTILVKSDPSLHPEQFDIH